MTGIRMPSVAVARYVGWNPRPGTFVEGRSSFEGLMRNTISVAASLPWLSRACGTVHSQGVSRFLKLLS